MTFDDHKIDDAVLALLYVTLHDGSRVWKRFDWESMARLFAMGLISDPATKARSVVLTDSGLRKAKRLFDERFAQPRYVAAPANTSKFGVKVTPASKFFAYMKPVVLSTSSLVS
jgi:Domain of unknown function (DUF6429)